MARRVARVISYFYDDARHAVIGYGTRGQVVAIAPLDADSLSYWTSGYRRTEIEDMLFAARKRWPTAVRVKEPPANKPIRRRCRR